MSRKVKKGGRPKRKAKGASEGPFLGPEQRREMLAYGLLGLAVLVLLALVPSAWLGGLGEDLPSGNLIGALGARLQAFLVGGLGAVSVLIPALLAVGGAAAGGWMGRAWATRLGMLGGGLLVVLSILLHLWSGGGPWGGEVGAWLGGPLAALVGGIGASVLGVLGLIVLSVATLRWNPVHPIGRAVVQGSGALGSAARKAREHLRITPTTEERARLADESAWEDEEAQDPEQPTRVLEPEAASPSPLERKAPAGEGAAHVDEGKATKRGKAAQTAKPQDAPLLVDPASAQDLVGVPLPTLDLLTAPEEQDRQGMDRELDALGQVLVEKLRSFSVESSIGGRTSGPVVTQFEVIPAPGVKVNRIANLDADLALAMKARSIRIVAPIPGKGAVGVEIPNPEPQIVFLREALESGAFRSTRASLPLALGRDLTGKPYVADLAKMPHVLIAGATGAGKSVCLNTIITSLVYKHTPETLRLLLIDPKMVELSTYSDLPHLRHSVVTDPKDAAGVLKWAVLEMERRYELLSANGVRSIGDFNRRLRSGVTIRRVHADGAEGDPDRWIYDDGVLPYVVLVIDELADLMMSVQSEIEKPLTQLAQKARAIGIHLIVATQRPSVNVITGLIKANFPTRIAFRVASKTDSRTILDQNGADALLGNGDMLFLPPGQSEPVRIQGAYITTEDTDQLMDWFRARRDEKRAAQAAAFDEAAAAEEDILEVVRELEAVEGGDLGLDDGSADRDQLFRVAAEACIQNKGGSTSLLQRKLRIGYGRAARIVDQLHEAGVLGAPDGSKPRDVLIGMDALDLLESGFD